MRKREGRLAKHGVTNDRDMALIVCVEPYADGPYYVGYKLNELEVGLDPNGQAVVSYIDVVEIGSYLKTLLNAGATTHQDVKAVGEGLLIAQVKDKNGNVLGLRQSPK